MKLIELLEQSANRLDASDCYYGHGTATPEDEALYIVVEALGLHYATVHESFDKVISSEQVKLVDDLIARRINERIPAAYILGIAYFAGLRFFIDERALVPRSPIAELIQNRFAPWYEGPATGAHILDMCTGSGCIGIAAAQYFEHSEAILCDISYEALNLARKNVEYHKMGDRIRLVEGDGIGALKQASTKEPDPRFDLVLCNPPYVDDDDLSSMPAEYHHEPALGLGSGHDGLDFTREFLRAVLKYIHQHTLIVLELGNSIEAFAAAYPQLNFVLPDLEQGGHGVALIYGKDLLSEAL